MAAARREEGDLILISSPMHEEGRTPGEQRERSGEVAEHISMAGGRMLATDLERQIRRGLLGQL